MVKVWWGMRNVVRERYYEHRAAVYDATSYRGDPDVDAALDRETGELGAVLAQLPTGRALDVGCGTAVWTRFLQGRVVALDQSAAMLEIAHDRVPDASLVRARLPGLPFADDSFDVLLAANFFGLLRSSERALFLAEARRVARQLVVVDLRSDGDLPSEGLEHRVVGDTTYRVFRRRFTPEGLCAELDGEMLYPGRYFLAVRTVWAGGAAAGGMRA
jgi:ubiquinone/menaquinone biosynthesis C-methylase UbiE